MVPILFVGPFLGTHIIRGIKSRTRYPFGSLGGNPQLGECRTPFLLNKAKLPKMVLKQKTKKQLYSKTNLESLVLGGPPLQSLSKT